MTTPAKINFKLYQGSTFNEALRWESSTQVYVPITNVAKSAPLVVTAPNHGIPIEWRVRFSNILGTTELNSSDTYYQVTEATTDTITLNAVNSLGYKTYVQGGVVEYNKPIELVGVVARMQIRAKLDDPAVIEELTTENGMILIDNIKKTITLTIPATTTSLYTFSTAVYSLELITSGGQVTPFIQGNITLVKEVTR